MKKINKVCVSTPVRSKKKYQVCVIYKDGSHNGYYFNSLEDLPNNISTAIRNSEEIKKINK